MPDGKPAGIRCVQLNEDNLCLLFGQASRPAVCLQFKAELAICANKNSEALTILTQLELATCNYTQTT